MAPTARDYDSPPILGGARVVRFLGDAMNLSEKLKKWLGAEEVNLTAVAKDAGRRFDRDNCFGIAAEMAYYFLFAMFPFLLFLLTLLAYIPVENLTGVIMNTLKDVVPAEAFKLIESNVDALVGNRKGHILSFSIFLALWTSSNAVVSIMGGLNTAYSVKETRPFWKKRLLAIGLVVGFALFVGASAILLIFGPKIGAAVAGMFGLGDLFTMAWNSLRWVVIILLVSLAFSGMYYFAPNAKFPWRWLSVGSITAVTGWIVASVGFSFYVDHFGSYNKTYGTIGAVIVLLTWLYVSGMMILFGGEFNSALEQRVTRIRDVKSHSRR